MPWLHRYSPTPALAICGNCRLNAPVNPDLDRSKSRKWLQDLIAWKGEGLSDLLQIRGATSINIHRKTSCVDSSSNDGYFSDCELFTESYHNETCRQTKCCTSDSCDSCSGWHSSATSDCDALFLLLDSSDLAKSRWAHG